MARKAEDRKRAQRVNREERIELDNDPEEQAIQLEQDEVAVEMEKNLRKELILIEDQLIDF